jgi:hypothetical protein
VKALLKSFHKLEADLVGIGAARSAWLSSFYVFKRIKFRFLYLKQYQNHELTPTQRAR